jgi:hypothetical protein
MPLTTLGPWKVPQGLYCLSCAATFGLMVDVYTSDLSQSPYQDKKIAKHISPPDIITRPVSIFTSTDMRAYADLANVAAVAAEIDPWGRRNFLFACETHTGDTLQPDQTAFAADGLKLVKSSDAEQGHLYPHKTPPPITAPCSKCGGLAFTHFDFPPLGYSV